MSTSIRRLRADHALLPEGWGEDVGLGVDGEGRLVEVEARVPPGWGERIAGALLPGMPNLHSHAFQRAMAGRAEVLRKPEDSFWTWRELMYSHAARIGVDEQYRVASDLYRELLAHGYTWVCEFHYLHLRPEGQAYTPEEAMSLALIEAARDAGIGLTLLPVLYLSSGFDAAPIQPRQRRFVLAVDRLLHSLSALRRLENPRLRIGLALHSLRAVPPEPLAEVLAAEAGHARPIHIHVAEQLAEVEQCLAARGLRPVQWLFEHAEVGPRWCLVHATHVDSSELELIARSQAVVGLCPTTEANLGDGIFPLVDYVERGGHLGIGSDSHVSVDPVEELRWLEYVQRLLHRRRNLLAWPGLPHTGENLWRLAARGGAQAAGAAIGSIEAGMQADWLELDVESWPLAGCPRAQWLDAFIFAGGRSALRATWTGGKRTWSR